MSNNKERKYSEEVSAELASYKIAYMVAKSNEPQTITEELLLPCITEIVHSVIGKDAARKMSKIPLSNNTIQHRIADISTDLNIQIVQEMKGSPLFSIQLDETTDFSSDGQLLVYCRYIFSGSIKEEFLFCQNFEMTTNASDVIDIVSAYFERHGLSWNNLVGVTTDGAPAMLGSKSGFLTHVKERAPNATGIHCFIQCEALASKSLPLELNKLFKEIVKIVYYVRGLALETQLFEQLFADMDSTNETLLITSVRWLYEGKFLTRFFALRNKVKTLLETRGELDFLATFDTEHFEARLAYIVDILQVLNELKVKMQGKDSNMITHTDYIRAFLAKLQLYRNRVEHGNFVMFPNFKEVVTNNGLPDSVQQEIKEHLTCLREEFSEYLPDLEENMALVRNPFIYDVNLVPETAQEEFLELVNNSSAKDIFKEKKLEEFWFDMVNVYPKMSDIAMHILLPFGSTYLCESGFSALACIKWKSHNKLEVQDDLQCFLAKTAPRFEHILAQKKQLHSSH